MKSSSTSKKSPITSSIHKVTFPLTPSIISGLWKMFSGAFKIDQLSLHLWWVHCFWPLKTLQSVHLQWARKREKLCFFPSLCTYSERNTLRNFSPVLKKVLLGPYPIVGSNARYLYQTNLNVNVILAWGEVELRILNYGVMFYFPTITSSS